MKTFVSVILFLMTMNFSFAQKFEWVEQIGLDGGGNDGGNDLLLDSQGNVCVVGLVKNDSKFGNNDSNIVLSGYGTHDIFLSKYNNDGSFKWAKRYGSTGTDQGQNLTIDSNDNWYVGGYFSNSCVFDDTILVSSGATDCFVLSVDSLGELRWVFSFGGTENDIVWAMDSDEDGNTYISGYFNDTLYFGDTSIVSSGDWDIFVAKVGSGGNPQWIKRYGGELKNACNDIVLYGDNLYLTGYSAGTALFDSIEVSSIGSYDIFVCKMDTTGNVEWVNMEGGGSLDYGISIDVDSNNRVIVGGTFKYLAFFNQGDTSISSNGFEDVFISVYSVEGEFLDVFSFGGGDNDDLESIEIDNENNIYVGGRFKDTLLLHNNTFISLGSNDIFILQLNDTMGLNWLKQVEGVPYGGKEPTCKAMYCDSLFNLYVTGGFLTNIYFDSIYMEAYGISRDVYIGKIRPKVSGGFNSDLVVCEYDSILLYNTSNYVTSEVEWFFEGGVPSYSADFNPVIAYNSVGEFDVKLVAHGDNQTDTVFLENYISVSELPFVSLGDDFDACFGEVVQLSIDENYNSILWSTADTSAMISIDTTGLNWVQVWNEYGCTSSDSIFIQFRELPIINLGNDTLICENSVIELSSNNEDLSSYLWNTGDTISSIIVNNEDIYWLVGENEFGCFGSDTIYVGFEICLGVSEFGELSRPLIYPNPVEEYLIVKNEDKTHDISFIDILSIDGKLLNRYGINYKRMDVSHLIKGVYIIQITFDNGEKFSDKLIKL